MKNHPVTIIDIGAAGGIDSRWRRCLSDFQAILFEPDIHEWENLKACLRPNEVVLNAALYSHSTELNFFCCRSAQCSSLYRPNRELLNHYPFPERFDVMKTCMVVTDTLDNQLEKAQVSKAEFIKLDTQGSELAILEGAPRVLQGVIGLQIEVSFQHLYEDQPLFTDIHQFATSKNFSLFDLQRSYWNLDIERMRSDYNKGQLLFGDALYFKMPEHLVEEASTLDDPSAYLTHAVLLYLCYGYTDVAFKLVRLARDTRHFSEREVQTSILYIERRREKALLPPFRGRSRLYHCLQKLARKLFFVPSTVWNRGTDLVIGN